MNVADRDEIVAPLVIDWRAMPQDFLLAAPVTKISNTVVTCSLDEPRLDPSEIAHRLPGVLVDPKKFAAGTIRTKDAVALIFASGRVVCAGAPSVNAALQSALDVAKLLLDAGYMVRCINFTVQNIVMYSSAGFSVDIKAIADACPTDVQYDESRFPGATFRFHALNITITFFVSGPVIIAGARDVRDSRACWAWFYTNVLKRFRLPDDARPLTSADYRLATRRRDDTSLADVRAIRRQVDAATRQRVSAAVAEASVDELLRRAMEDAERELNGDADDDDVWSASAPPLVDDVYDLAAAVERLELDRGSNGDASAFAAYL